MLAVLLSIYAIIVRAHIRLPAVISVAKVKPLQTDPCLPSPSLNSLVFPTPVIIDRLDFLLSELSTFKLVCIVVRRS